jgi:DNA-binding response OmpR family regulator
MDPPAAAYRRTAAVVLVIDHDTADRQRIRAALEDEGHRLVEAGSAAEGVAHLDTADPLPDLVILEVDLPDRSGFDLLLERPLQDDIPVLFVTAEGDEEARVRGLDLGAADYIVKPFLPRELAARVRAALRHFHRRPAAALTHPDLAIHLAEREVRRRGVIVDLTRREFDLLVYLASRPRRAVSRRELLEQVWRSSDEWQDPATVTEHLRRLRHKLEDDPAQPRWLHTVRGVGYRFEP